MSKKDKTPLVAKLRFPKFQNEGPISFKNGDDVFEPISNKKHNADLPVLAITQDYGAIPRDLIDLNVSVTDKSVQNYKVVEIGDFIISLRSFQGGIEYSMYEGICSPAYIVLRKKIPVDELYYKYYFKTSKFIQDLNKDIEGIRDGKMISYNQFSSLLLPMPDIKEQQKIADCLSSLDDLVTAEDKKLEAYKARKKGLMQKLFPAEGKTVPEWRFPEFGGGKEWEEKKLGQIADVLMCKRIFAEQTNDKEGIPFYKIGTLGAKPDTFISKELFEEFKSKYNYPRKGEILITCSGTVGKCLPYNGQDAYYQDSNIVWIDNPTLEISNDLLLHLLLNVDWKQLNSTTITRIYGSDLRNLSIIFPEDKGEQQKIADCLTSMDSLIIAQSQKIEALSNHKKGLMQGLFPSADEVSV
jgi:type I restriction enzyme S subunit